MRRRRSLEMHFFVILIGGVRLLDMQTDLIHEFSDQNGVSIFEHSQAAPILIILLRHSGCPFCRRTLAEVASMTDAFANQGFSIGFVYLSGEEGMKKVLASYGLEHLPRFHDPETRLYRGLDLKRVSFRGLFNHRTWSKSFQIGFHHGLSWPDGDPLQLPGAFLIDQGAVVAGHASLSPADPPDFKSLLRPIMQVA